MTDPPAEEVRNTPQKKPRLVTRPRDDALQVITSRHELEAFMAEVDPAAPIAIDAERAQSFRYSGKAYLIQFHQYGCGTRLLDPIALSGPDGIAHLDDLSAALAGCEWVLHAASQDLPCLAEVGLIPQRIFDTELAGRLLGLSRVSLSPMLTQYLGIELAKAHSADDWSRRPLPASLLSYAALDVDYLVELRDAVGDDLQAAGKAAWAEQEFADVVERLTIRPADDPERWRNAKGLGRLRQPRELAVAKALWHVRDALARHADVAPGRILSDVSLVDAAASLAHTPADQVEAVLAGLNGFTGPFARRHRKRWTSAVAHTLSSDPASWPHRRRVRGVPSPRLWEQTNPAAAARWAAARPTLTEVAEDHSLPPENLLTVASLAQIVWPDDADRSVDGLRTALANVGARPWQQDLVAPALADALSRLA